MNLPFFPPRIAFLGAIALLTATAQAVPVSPGGVPAVLPGTTVAARPELAGTLLDDIVTPWASAIDPNYGFPGAEGSLQSRVLRETATGTLDFYWRVTVNGASYPNFIPDLLALSGFSLTNFGTGSAFDADYRIDGLGSSAPSNAYSTDASRFAYVFNHATVGPGTSTYFLLLHSNAVDYDKSAFASLGVTSVATFAPLAAVPEPGSWAMLVAGLGVLGMVRRRVDPGSLA